MQKAAPFSENRYKNHSIYRNCDCDRADSASGIRGYTAGDCRIFRLRSAVVLLIFSLPYAYRDLIRGFRFLIESNAVTRKFFHDAGYQVVFTTIFSMGINLAYMIYNAVWGILNHSPWFITLAVYYSFLGESGRIPCIKKEKQSLQRMKEKQGRRNCW